MTREEAINEIKSWAIPSKRGREVLETLIPELREIEDEKIRKALIDGVSQIRCKGDVTREQMIAYLEKQKEQNLVPCNAQCGECPCFISGMNYQKEQKPILKFRIGDTIRKKTQPTWIKQITSIFEDKTYITGTGTDAYGIKVSEQDDWELVDQKPVDYEHEMWKNCEANFEGGKKEVIDHPEKYGLQKHAEWNEEDDATIKSAVHWLEKYLSTIRAKDVSSATQDGILTVKTTITNLKSFGSSWKPSEEEMKAFRRCIEDLQARAEAAVGGWDNFNVMIRLYEELKKL